MISAAARINTGTAVPCPPKTSFVIDTSRNGQGPWEPGDYPDPQDWCNPPDRGLGLAPTLDTGIPLVDAYLWVKIPGESDGECTRGLGDSGDTIDPEWDIVDPSAGVWFPEMALDFVHNAIVDRFYCQNLSWETSRRFRRLHRRFGRVASKE